MTFGEEAADAAVDKQAPGWIGDIAQRVRPIFGVVREPRIGGDADIAGGEIGEQRILAGSAVAVAVVAFRLAPEEVIADLLLAMNCVSWASTASNLEVKEVTSAEAHSCRWTAPSDQSRRVS